MNTEKFCRHCGKSLNGQQCHCPQAVELRQQEKTAQKDISPLSPEPLVVDKIVADENLEEQVLPPEIHSYTPPSHFTPQIMDEPLQGDMPTTEQGFQMPPKITQAAMSIKTVVKNFFSNPIESMETGNDFPASTGLLLLGVNFGVLFLFWCVFLLKIAKTLGSFKVAVIYPLAAFALSVGILLGVLLLGNQLFSAKGRFNELLNIVSLSTIPGVGVGVVTVIFTLLFGFTTVTYTVVVFTFIFGLTFTVLLLEHALRQKIENIPHRTIVLAVAVALQLTIAGRFFMSGVSQEIATVIASNFLGLW